MRFKLKTRITTCLVCFVLLLHFFPSYAFAIDGLEAEADTTVPSDSAPVRVKELIEKRTENSKHYLMSDNTYQAEIYPTPVHFFENDEWKEYDHTLEVRQGRLEVKESDRSISFGTSGEDPLLMIGEENPLCFDLIGQQIKEPTSASNEGEVMLNNSITYNNLFEDTDVIYDLSPGQIKESIVVQQPGNQTKYQFRIMGDYNLIKRADNSIDVYSQSELIYHFSAPYMFDSVGESSNSINVLLEKYSGYTMMTLIPDKTWMADPNRIYPITIDPTIIVPGTAALNARVGQDEITVDYFDDRILTFTSAPYDSLEFYGDFFDTIDDQIENSGGYMIDARFGFCMWRPYSGLSANISATVHQNTGNGYEESRVGYVEFLSEQIQEVEAYNTSFVVNRYLADITQIVHDWYATSDTDRKFMIKYTNGFTGEYLSAQSLTASYVQITYIMKSGIDGTDIFSVQQLGAVNGLVNNLTGFAAAQFTDYSSSNLRSELSLGHVYSDQLSTPLSSYSGSYGKNFTFTIEEYLIDVSEDSSGARYDYIDGAGNHYFFEHTTEEVIENGIISINEYYKSIDIPNCTLTISSNESVLTFENGVEKHFSNNRISYILDKNGNRINVEYTYLGGKVVPWKIHEVISDSVSRTTTLNWDSATGRLYRIDGADGSSVYYTYTGQNLTEVTYANRGSFEIDGAACGSGELYTLWFRYDSNGYLLSVEDRITGNKATYSRDTNHRVISVTTTAKYKDTGETFTTGSASFKYGFKITKVTDNINDQYVIYTFNNAGQVMTTTDSEGLSQFYNYEVEDSKWSDNINFVSVVQERDSAGENLIEQCQWLNNYKYQFTPTVSGFYTFVADIMVGSSDVIDAEISAGWKRTTNKTPAKPMEWTETRIGCEMVAGTTYTIFFAQSLSDTDFMLRRPYLYNGRQNKKINLLQNSAFSNGLTEWSGDGIETSGTLYLGGDGTQEQTVIITGSAGDLFTFGGSGNTEGLSNIDDIDLLESRASLELEIRYVAGSKKVCDTKEIQFFFNTNGDWLDIFGSLEAEYDYSSVIFKVKQVNNQRPSYFDNMRLYLNQPFGTAYYYTDQKVISSENEETGTSRYTYNEAGDKASETDSKGRTTYYYYDENRNLTESVLNYRTLYEYDAFGNLEKVTTSKANLSDALYGGETIYNADGTAIVGQKDSFGNTVTYAIDYQTLLTVGSSAPNGVTENLSFYHNNNDVINGVVRTKTRYNSANQMLSHVGFEYSGGALSTIKRNNFDYVIKDGLKANETVTVDGTAEQVITKSTVEIKNANYKIADLGTNYYNAKGQLIKSVMGNGSETLFAYDSGGRISYSSGSVGTYRYYYSPAGQLDRVVNTLTNEFTDYYYDKVGRVLNTTSVNRWNSFFNTYYRYDTDGMLKQKAHAVNGFEVDTLYSYGSDKTLSSYSVNFSGNTMQPLTSQYTYDDYGRLAEKTINNGQLATMSYEYKTIAGNKTAVLSKINTEIPDGQNGLIADFETEVLYDSLGNISEVHCKYFGVTDYYEIPYYSNRYSYDGLNQLTFVDYGNGNFDTFSYVNSAGEGMQGNIATRDREGHPVWYFSYSGSWNDQLIEITDSWHNTVKLFTYDESGNMLSDGTKNFTWNGNRLTSVSYPNDGAETTAYFTYNSSGLRTSKTIQDTVYEYFYSDDQLVSQTVTREHESTVYMNYCYGETGLEWILYKKVAYDGTILAEKLYSVGHNPQGMIDMLREYNYSSMEYQRSYFITYKAFGEMSGISEMFTASYDTVADYSILEDVLTVRYKDYLFDQETGLYYLQQRYYDPEIYRFISPDSLIAEGQGTNSYNLYAYCGNNPIMFADPSGEELASITMAFCFFVAWVSAASTALTVIHCVSTFIDLSEEISRSSPGQGYHITLLGKEYALGNRFGKIVYFAMDSIGEEMIAGTIAFLELMDFCDEFHIDVETKVAIGIFYFAINQAEVVIPGKKWDLVFGADALFTYASAWYEVIKRDYVDNVDAEYMESSHMVQEMFTMIRFGRYGG